MANYVSNVTIPTDGGSTASYDIRELFPHVGNCTVAASAAAKTVTIGNFKLYTGAWVVVKFSNTNTADVASLTLNVDGTGAKPIKYRNANLSSAGLLIANRYTYFIYDGTNYQIVGDFDTNVTQTNTTTSADYRVLLSGNANDTTETTTGRKSANLKFNPSSGGLYSFGFLWTDITGSTLDINTLTLSNGTLHSRRFIEKTDGGAANITNIPVTGHPFLLEVDLIRWGSKTDYITRQRFTNAANGTYSYVRYCTNGTWGSWTTRKYTDTDTKVTSSANHYTPATVSGQDKSASASGATAAWSIDVVKGVTLNTDGKGHVTGLSVTSGKIPANPVPSNNVTGSGTSGYLTKWNGTNTITNGPQLGSSTTTFLRNDGTWATPTNTTYSANNGVGLSGTTFYNSGVRAVSTGSANGTISVNTNGTSANVAVKGLGTAAYKASSDFAVSQTLANDTNLNNITTPGFYNCGGTNSVTNKPSNVDAFGLNVIHDASGQWYTQILYPNNASPLIYVRNYNGSAWSGWNSIAIGSFLPLSGGTMTGTLTAKASQYADAYSGALDMNNSNIYGVNSIYTTDVSDNAAEGIHFYRDSTHVDTLWMNGGSLLFVPNRELGTSTTAANSQKVARFTANPTSGQVVITDGTAGGIKSSGYTIAKSVPSNAVFTDHITTVTSSGSGNAVTAISADANGALTVTKGSTFSSSTHTHDSLYGAQSSSAVPVTTLSNGRLKVFYNVNNGLSGNMPATNNANAIIQINKHGGDYDSQLGFSSDGNIYYRSCNGSALSASVPWRRIYDTSNPPTASEVGALASTTKYAGSSSVGGAANSSNVLNSNARMDYGWDGVNYFNINGTAGNAAKVNDTPTSAWWHIMRFNNYNSSGYYTDLAIPFGTTSLYYKRITGGSVQNGGWVRVLDSLNYTSYTYNATASRTANTVLAAPDGSDGTASFRKLVAGDLPDSYLPLSGGKMTGTIQGTYTNTHIALADGGIGDYASLDHKNNINISSWNGISISNGCSSVGTLDQVTFSVNARTGTTQQRGNAILYGYVRQYSTNAYYTDLKPNTLTASRTILLPDAAGTIAVFTATPTSGQVVVADGTAGGIKSRALVAADLPSHTHNYAGSSSAGGAATSANALNLTHGNELNFSKLASTGHVWFGYRWNTQGTETNGGTTITTYKFGNANGAGGFAGLEANSLILHEGSGSATLKAKAQSTSGTYLLPACGNGTYTLSIGMTQVGGVGNSLVISNVSGIPTGTFSFKIIFKSDAGLPIYSMIEIPNVGDDIDCGGMIQVGDYTDGQQGSLRIVMKSVIIRVTAGTTAGTKTFTATVSPTQKISGSSVSEFTRNVIMWKIYACC